MEPEKTQQKIEPESQEDFLTKKVGTLEKEKLEALPVVVKDVSVQPLIKKDTKKVAGKMLHIYCKHPKKEEIVDMTKILYRKTEEDAVKELGLWYNEDKEKNIQKGSPVAILMDFVQIEYLADLIDKEIETKHNAEGYLAIKAY